jgi:hypothetical protein
VLAFDDIKPGSRLRGLAGSGVAEIVQVARFGADALNLVFRANGRVGERLLYRGEETALELVEAGRAYGFDADGALLRLASEAYRIRLAHLCDPYLAVTTSQIDALPHQITAVYGEMLPRQPLRFLLADDAGAGKTIMAGLLVKELLIRGDLGARGHVEPHDQPMVLGERVAGRRRLDLGVRISKRRPNFSAISSCHCSTRLPGAAIRQRSRVKETQRYRLGKLLGTRTRNLLLMSATPHNGKEADFPLFMGLLDTDRIEGRFRGGIYCPAQE